MFETPVVPSKVKKPLGLGDNPFDDLGDFLRDPFGSQAAYEKTQPVVQQAMAGTPLQGLNDFMNNPAVQSVQNVFPPQVAGIKTPVSIVDTLQRAGTLSNAIAEGQNLANDLAPRAVSALNNYVKFTAVDDLLHSPLDQISTLRAITQEILKRMYPGENNLLLSRIVSASSAPRRGLSYSLGGPAESVLGPVMENYKSVVQNMPFNGGLYKSPLEILTERVPRREILATYNTLPYLFSEFPAEREAVRLPEDIMAKLRRARFGTP